jgi:transposase
MGEDKIRMAFFETFIKEMRKKNPRFGRGCYVDSTPLPNDIDDNPFNALCSHGIGSASVQMRLALVLDEETGLPVWYDIIPGNILDISTIMTILNDVAISLDIEIDSLVLDAGYVSKELISAFHIGTEKTIIGRMPGRKGFPFKDLYWEFKDQISKGKYTFVRKHHAYFGKRKEIELFGHKEYAYVYVDKNNALQRFRDYLVKNEKEYDSLKDKDKDWATIKYGYFILLSNLEKTPSELLSNYFERVDIEIVFKTSKEYLGLLPLSKWSTQTVRGKILHDIINTIILLLLRKEIDSTGISTTELSGKTQSLMCFRDNNGCVTVETPNKLTREYYGLLGLSIPSQVKINEFKTEVLKLI